ncbi:hypothetical protein BDM02DRAFT_1978898 [Thelephora ganbajun]|uniref:Uncharacterized protein n=1 Tax=Thelephora ganbajun TaxID=370292 RepID=A0ACB6ZHA0_THEGA|nr:hypothetical protein BDM02DRAFT_1978898 [Thelephora ganbajun]
MPRSGTIAIFVILTPLWPRGPEVAQNRPGWAFPPSVRSVEWTSKRSKQMLTCGIHNRGIFDPTQEVRVTRLVPDDFGRVSNLKHILVNHSPKRARPPHNCGSHNRKAKEGVRAGYSLALMIYAYRKSKIKFKTRPQHTRPASLGILH